MDFPSELRQAIRDCRERGLLVASKWAAECLSAIPLENRIPPPAGLDNLLPVGFGASTSSGGLHGSPLPFHTSTPSRPVAASSSTAHPLHASHLRSPELRRGRPSLSTMSPSDFIPQSPAPGLLDGLHGGGSSSGSGGPSLVTADDVNEADTYDLARSYFDVRELDRCEWTLRMCTGAKATFLRAYARYLIIDKRMQEDLVEVFGGPDDRHQLSASFQPILSELRDTTDPFMLYLKGTIYLRLRQRPEAAAAFIESINGYVYNWSAFVGLTACVSTADELKTVLSLLPNHPFTECFEIQTKADYGALLDEAEELIENLEDRVFSIGRTESGQQQGQTWIWGTVQRALIAVTRQDHDTAIVLFETIKRLDPHRLDNIDVFSNTLYVKPDLPKLAQLAKEYNKIDRNRPETCALIGNFYSSRGEHPKAITYFRRALQLNRNYLPAWTLMGHEFVEMRNSHAAIEAYRRAADSNPRDYRAWYGLGHAYEMLDMAQYSILYYNKATALRPEDPRMWAALASVYKESQRLPEAILCFRRELDALERAGRVDWTDPNHNPIAILFKLAELDAELGRYEDAAVDTRAALGRCNVEGKVGMGGDQAHGLLWLARFELGEYVEEGEVERRKEPNWPLAASYLQAIVKHNVPEKDMALALLAQIEIDQARADAEA